MIMNPGKPLLLPVNPLFIGMSLLLALILDLTLNMAGAGRGGWVPDVLAVVLVFWTVHQPLRVGVGVAFFLGLCMDVHDAALLGQHALVYSVLSFMAISIHRRLLWFALMSQALQIFPLLALTQALELVVRLMAGGAWPGWSMLLAPVLEAALWPLITVVLLAPQRRAPDPDETRPL